MGKSSGIPYFCGNRIAHNAKVTDMQGNVNPIIKVFPRNIGAVVKGSGVISKTITLDCRTIPPANSGRSAIEAFMNNFNEAHGIKVGTLTIDDNDYYNCGIKSIAYDEKITDGYVKYSVEFDIGVQQEDLEAEAITTDRQLIPSKLFYDTRGRVARFTSTKSGKVFNFVHNVDTVRNLGTSLVVELFDKESKDVEVRYNGGVETLKAFCWMKATGEDQEDGWRQTVGAYIYNIMTGPVGDSGTFVLGTNTLKNILLTGVTLTECYPTSARYELTFLISLQC